MFHINSNKQNMQSQLMLEYYTQLVSTYLKTFLHFVNYTYLQHNRYTTGKI